jgi:hypothetical protein
MKKIVLTGFLSFFMIKAFSQSPDAKIKFCDRMGEGESEVIRISREELNKCNFILIPSDTNFTVISFRMSLFSTNRIRRLKEIKINGNSIPVNERTQIEHSGKILLEYVKAKASDNALILMQPVTVIIE